MYQDCYYQGTPYMDEDYLVPTQANPMSYGQGNNMGGTPVMPYTQPQTMQGGMPFTQTPMFQQTPVPGYGVPMPGFQAPMPSFQAPMAGMGDTGGPDFEMEPGAPVQKDINYTQGYLRTLIGRRVKIEFLIGTDLFIDREGILTQVGISYVVIKEVNTNNLVMCDIYSIKFVNIFNGNAGSTGGTGSSS